MLARFGDWISALQFFLSKFDLLLKGKFSFKNESGLEWVKQFFDFLGGFCDNFVYLNRVKLRTWKSKWEEIWIDWLSSACCITFILLSMI
jgi:hypothetical protein